MLRIAGLIGVALVALTAGSAGAEKLMAKETNHPWLYFTQRDMARIRKADFAASQYLDEKEFTLKYFGGKTITFSLPPKEPGKLEEPPGFDYKTYGHYPYWTALGRAIQTRLESLALAYAVSGDARYADRAIEYCLSLSKWSTWTDLDYGKTTCLDTAHLTLGVAMVYDICYDRMSPEQRGAICEAMVRLGLEPQLRDNEPTIEHNLQMLRASALGVGGAAVLGEEPKAGEYVAASRDYFRWFLDSRETSPNTEGLLYTSYGVDYCMQFADVLARSTGDESLLRHSYLPTLVKWVLYFWGPAVSGAVNFSDCSSATYYGLTMRVLHNSTKNGLAGWYLKKAGLDKARGADAVLYDVPELTVESPESLPSSAEFRNIGYAALRSGWGDTDSLFAFICSNSTMGHCHPDAAHFVLNCAGEWLITDPGYGSFEGGAKSFYSRNTIGHNSLLVDGEGQDKTGGGKIDYFYQSPLLDMVTGDASGSYASSKLSRFVRNVAFLRPDCYVIYDQVAAPAKASFETLLHTDATGQYLFANGAKTPVSNANWMVIEKPRARVQADFMLPLERKVELKTYPGAEEYGPYLSISPSAKTENSQFLTVLRPRAKADKDEPVAPLPAPELVESLSGKGAGIRLGADQVIFGMPGETTSAGGLQFNGRCVLMRRAGDRSPVAYALCDGTELRIAKNSLIQSDKPISASLEAKGGALTGVLEAQTTGSVRLYAPNVTSALIDGVSIKPEYDSGSKQVILQLTPGRHSIEIH